MILFSNTPGFSRQYAGTLNLPFKKTDFLLPEPLP